MEVFSTVKKLSTGQGRLWDSALFFMEKYQRSSSQSFKIN